MQQYDIIIIGTGPAAEHWPENLPRQVKKSLSSNVAIISHAKKKWDTEAVFLKGRYKAKENCTNKNGKSFHPGIHYCVGGNTKVYGAALLRLREQDFQEIKHHAGFHRPGI